MRSYYDFESFYEKMENLENKIKDLPEKPKKPITPKISETPSFKEIEEYKIKLDLYSNGLKSFEKNMNDYELEVENISDFNDSLWQEASDLFEEETDLKLFNSSVKDRVYSICYDNASDCYGGKLSMFKNYFNLTTELVKLLNLK
jgi:chromosome segregation ATPase